MTAAEVFEVRLEKHEHTGWRRIRVGAWALATAVAQGFVGSPSVGEWVVRHRADGRELFRVDAGDEEEAAVLRAELDRQLEQLTPDEFAARWATAQE
jgi:hypothetical protein